MSEILHEISDDIFLAGNLSKNSELASNIYLMLDRNEAVLFGAGSALDFEVLYSIISDKININTISYIILQNPDISICSALPLYEQCGFSGQIITHWKSAREIKSLGIKSGIIYSNFTANRLRLESGRVIRFINTPNLFSAGSFAAHDQQSGIMFTGNLFGAYLKKWQPDADENCISEIKRYHDEYAPPVQLESYIRNDLINKQITMFAPQHGPVIRGNIRDTVSSIFETQVGSSYPAGPESDTGPRLVELQKKCNELENENKALSENMVNLKRDFEKNAIKDPLALIYKEDMFRENLITDISAYMELGIDFGFFIFEIDNLVALNKKYGRDAGDEILLNASYLLKNFKKSNRNYAHHLIFKMNGPRYTYYCTDASIDEVSSIAEDVRLKFSESGIFITGITIAAGVVHSSEFDMNGKTPAVISENIIEVANSRLRLAKHSGGNSVCNKSETSELLYSEKYIMVVDPDISVRYMLESQLKREGFNVITCSMGDEALHQIDTRKPQMIISEVMLPKIDGFSLRKHMLEDSELKDIPFILTSAVKNEMSIIRAHSLEIFHYFKKPYSIVEVTGLLKKLSEEDSAKNDF